MVSEAANLMLDAVQNSIGAKVLINNRAGGNAPIIAQKVVEKFLADKGQDNRK